MMMMMTCGDQATHPKPEVVVVMLEIAGDGGARHSALGDMRREEKRKGKRKSAAILAR